MDDVITSFNRLRFSTPEAASILDMPLATLKTRLQRGWLPVADAAPGEWRKWTPDDLLRCKLAEVLSKRGVPFDAGKQIVHGLAPTWFDGQVFLVVFPDRAPSTPVSELCGVPDLGIILGNNTDESAIVVNKNEVSNWLRGRFDSFFADSTSTGKG